MATPDLRPLKHQLLEADIKFRLVWEKNGRPGDWLSQMTDEEVAGSFLRRCGDYALEEWIKSPPDYVDAHPSVGQLLVKALEEK